MYQIVRQEGNVTLPGYIEVLVQTESDVNNLPMDCAPGSLAYNENLSIVWQFGLDKQWHRC